MRHSLYLGFVIAFWSAPRDGSRPFGPLVQDADGTLYGVAQQGGDLSCPGFPNPGFPNPEFPERGCGTVFRISKDRVLSIVHTISGGAAGAVPQAGLLRDGAGNLYGTTVRGGKSDNGTVFSTSN